MDAKNTTGAAKFVVDGAKVDLLDAELSKKTGAHDARFDRNVKNTLSQNGAFNSWGTVEFLSVGVQMTLSDVLVVHGEEVRLIVWHIKLRPFAGLLAKLSIDDLFTIVGSVGQQGGQCHELGMSGTIPSYVGGIHASRDDRSVIDENAAYWRFVGFQSEASLFIQLGVPSPGFGFNARQYMGAAYHV